MENSIYQCGPFKYQLPKCSCVFCKNCESVFWDYSHGIYAIICPKYYPDINGNITGECKSYIEEGENQS